MVSGISHVARGRDGAWTIASFITRNADAESEAALIEHAPLTQLLTCHLHDAVTRIKGFRNVGDIVAKLPRPLAGNLSAREREGLALAARGKTADKVALILGISVFTATDHFKDIRRKLGAANMAHAIALAIAKGYLSGHQAAEISLHP